MDVILVYGEIAGFVEDVYRRPNRPKITTFYRWLATDRDDKLIGYRTDHKAATTAVYNAFTGGRAEE